MNEHEKIIKKIFFTEITKNLNEHVQKIFYSAKKYCKSANLDCKKVIRSRLEKAISMKAPEEWNPTVDIHFLQILTWT